MEISLVLAKLHCFLKLWWLSNFWQAFKLFQTQKCNFVGGTKNWCVFTSESWYFLWIFIALGGQNCKIFVIFLGPEKAQEFWQKSARRNYTNWTPKSARLARKSARNGSTAELTPMLNNTKSPNNLAKMYSRIMPNVKGKKMSLFFKNLKYTWNFNKKAKMQIKEKNVKKCTKFR